VINAIRAHMAEFGTVAPVGRKGVEQLLAIVTDVSDQRVPEVARAFANQEPSTHGTKRTRRHRWRRRYNARLKPDKPGQRAKLLSRVHLQAWKP
jgi:hypothetical protein